MLPMLCSPRLVGTDSLHLHHGPVDELKLILLTIDNDMLSLLVRITQLVRKGAR